MGARSVAARSAFADNQQQMETAHFHRTCWHPDADDENARTDPTWRQDSQEQLAILFRQVQTTKATKAQELLARRSQIRRNSHASRPTMGPQGISHLAATAGTFIRWARLPPRCVATGFFIYVRFKFGLSPLERYYLPYYLRSGSRVSRIQQTRIECSESRTADPSGDSPSTPMCSQGPRCSLMARHCH